MGTLTPHNANKTLGDKDAMKDTKTPNGIVTLEPSDDGTEPVIEIPASAFTAKHSHERNQAAQHYGFIVAPWTPIAYILAGFFAGGFGQQLGAYAENSSPYQWTMWTVASTVMGALAYFCGLIAFRGTESRSANRRRINAIYGTLIHHVDDFQSSEPAEREPDFANACSCHDAQLCPDESRAH